MPHLHFSSIQHSITSSNVTNQCKSSSHDDLTSCWSDTSCGERETEWLHSTRDVKLRRWTLKLKATWWWRWSFITLTYLQLDVRKLHIHYHVAFSFKVSSSSNPFASKSCRFWCKWMLVGSSTNLLLQIHVAFDVSECELHHQVTLLHRSHVAFDVS